jgi:hypothetical protein
MTSTIRPYVTFPFPGEGSYIRELSLAIGEAVMVLSECETVILDFGYITGVEYNPSYSFIKGWWYKVHFTDGPSQGYQDWIPERDLTSVSLCSPNVNYTP